MIIQMILQQPLRCPASMTAALRRGQWDVGLRMMWQLAGFCHTTGTS